MKKFRVDLILQHYKTIVISANDVEEARRLVSYMDPNKILTTMEPHDLVPTDVSEVMDGEEKRYQEIKPLDAARQDAPVGIDGTDY